LPFEEPQTNCKNDETGKNPELDQHVNPINLVRGVIHESHFAPAGKIVQPNLAGS